MAHTVSETEVSDNSMDCSLHFAAIAAEIEDTHALAMRKAVGLNFCTSG